MSQPDDVERALHDLDAELGGLDILVNNAGIAHVGTIEQTSPEDFDRLFAVNVRGVYLCSRAAVTIMVRQGHGVILHMASMTRPFVPTTARTSGSAVPVPQPASITEEPWDSPTRRSSASRIALRTR